MRLIKRITVLAICLFAFFLTACRTDEGIKGENFGQCLSVSFIDVGEGDCIFMLFPDGKTLMIDTGESSDKTRKTIDGVIKDYAVKGIDYLVLTHTDSDHIGNATYILNNYNVGTAYIPYSVFPESFPKFFETLSALKDKGIKTEYNEMYKTVSGDGYKMTFLSPYPAEIEESEYNAFNKTPDPTKSERNAVSPIIFLEYNGVRFLFTGDAVKTVENTVINNYKSGLYSNYGVKLEEIDFLKVSHHGADDGSSNEFLEVVKPRKAVISVGGDNYYGHPDSDCLNRILTANPECGILRTDVSGTITVMVDKNAKLV